MFSQLKSFASQTVIYGLSTSGQKIIGIFLMPIYMRFLSPTDYGILEILTITNSFIGILFSFSIKSGIFRWYYDINEDDKKRLISTCYNALFIVNAFIIVLLIILRKPISNILFDNQEFAILLTISLMTLLPTQLSEVPQGLLRAQNRAKDFAIILNCNSLLKIILTIILIVIYGLGIWGMIYAKFIVNIVFMLIYFLVIKNYYHFFVLDIRLLKKLLSYSFPLAIAMIPTVLIDMGDRYFLLGFSNLHEVGLYSVGYKLAFFVKQVIVWPFALAWGPFVMSIKKKNDAKNIYSRIADYYLLFSLFLVLIISLYSKELFMLIAPRNYWEAYKVVPILTVSYCVYGLFTIFNVGAYITKKTKKIPIITAVAVCINLGFNYLLIPFWGMLGAAVATLISHAVMSIGMFYLSQTVYRINYSMIRIAKIGSIYLLILLLGFFIRFNDLLSSLLFKTVMVFLFPTLIWATKFFYYEEIIKFKSLRRKYLHKFVD